MRGSPPGRRPQLERDFPLRPLRQLLVVIVLLGVALDGVEQQPAVAAPRETPGRKITRLRAKAARVQAAIDRMHARVEVLVEDYNEVREALARTRVEQAGTRRQVLDARRRLRATRRLLGKRLWTIYTGGAPSTLGQLLAADSVHQALVSTKYQEQVVGADRAERQERLRSRLVAKRRQIESRLAAHRRYLKRLTRQVRKAVVQERRRQERLGRRFVAGPAWAASPSVTCVLRLQHRQPGLHPSRRHVHRRRGHDRGPYSGASVRISSIGRRDYIGAVRPTG